MRDGNAGEEAIAVAMCLFSTSRWNPTQLQGAPGAVHEQTCLSHAHVVAGRDLQNHETSATRLPMQQVKPMPCQRKEVHNTAGDGSLTHERTHTVTKEYKGKAIRRTARLTSYPLSAGSCSGTEIVSVTHPVALARQKNGSASSALLGLPVECASLPR